MKHGVLQRFGGHWRLVGVGLMLGVGLGACGDDKDTRVDGAGQDGWAVPDGAGDGGSEKGDEVAGDEVSPDNQPNKLSFSSGMVGSNGLGCAAQCAMRVPAGDEVELAVVYRDAAGAPLPDRMIRWSTGDTPDDLMWLRQRTSVTDAEGVARAQVRSGGFAGSATVAAQADGDADAGTLIFTLSYEAPAEPALVVSFQYLGSGPWAEFSLRLFHEVPGGPTCASLYPDAPGAAAFAPDVVVEGVERGRQRALATLPGLDSAGTQRWVVQVVAPGGGAPLAAAGCVEGVSVTRGATAATTVYVRDLPKRFQGDYQVITRIDSLSGAQGTALGTLLTTLTDLFTQPGRLLVVWACGNQPSGVLGTVCGWITNSSGEPNFVGAIIVDAANAALLDLLSRALGPQAQSASEIISEMLRELRLVSRLGMRTEPYVVRGGFNGAFFGSGEVVEEWTHVRFRWKFDPRCKNAPDPSLCGWTEIPMEAIYGLRPTAAPEAGIDAALGLHVVTHAVPQLTYGPLINAVLEQRLLGLVFAGGGSTPVASWDDLVSTLFGDRACLDYDDCCEYFADKLEDTTVGSAVSWDNRVLACELAIPLIAQTIRGQLMRWNGALNLGTRAEAPCPARDGDEDRWVDGFGTSAAPCSWDLYFPVNSGRFAPNNDWSAGRP